MAYHVTLKSNLEQILKNGLIPFIGKRSQNLGETEKAIYFFHSLEDCDNALWNWLGEEYEDTEEDLVILEVEVDNKWISFDTNGNVFYELKVLEKIPSKHIKRILNENYEELIV